MTLTLPFRLRGVDGHVAVEYSRNEDPYRWGYGLLGLPYAPECARGFPVCQAVVTCAGEGYQAMMGWIQVVRYHADVSVEGIGSAVLVDGPPQFQAAKAQVPYAAWGVCPTFFDAPSMTARGVTWTADAFLVVSPDALMSAVVQPVCGFSWGFTTHNGQATPTSLVFAGVAQWEDAARVLRDQYPYWEFRPEWADERTK